MAKDAAIPAKPAAARRHGQLAGTLALVLAVAAALAALPLTLIAIPGMMPSFAVLLADRQRPRYLSYAVTLMNLAGILPFLLSVGRGGMTLAAAAQRLADPLTWLVMYGVAAIGWLVWAAFPAVAHRYVELQARARRRALEHHIELLRAEWGGDIAARRAPAETNGS